MMVITNLLLAAAFVRTSLGACQSDADCLWLGVCDMSSRECHCRQGFTGPECGQLDVAPAPNHLGYYNSSTSTWGGLPVFAKDGLWHMYVAMMVGECPLGTFNNNSAVAHLVSTTSSFQGPYKYVNMVTPPFAHNPTSRVLPDGTIAIWYIAYDGDVKTISCPNGTPPQAPIWPNFNGKQIALAHSRSGDPNGPWIKTYLFSKTEVPQNWWHWDCDATNPAPLLLADGSVKMMYRGTMCTHCDGCPPKPGNASERLGIATAMSVDGPYHRPANAINLGMGVSVEDPYFWQGDSPGVYHLIAHSGTVCKAHRGSSWCGVIASSSDNGTSWKLAKDAAYTPNVTLVNGTTVVLSARQRPQLIFDPDSSKIPKKLLALVNGAELSGTGSFMQAKSFTLIQPVN
eukprot:m.66116 g.66116  ORF g.66116 m.66116 type:complete len:400 (-) comp11783_c0_seq2:3682-4881(-)